MPDFDIIITSWNRLDYLKRTIASLIQSHAFEAAKRVIIVDNGSTENGVHAFLEDLRRTYGAFLVLLPHNRGWGQAVNEALGLSRSPFLMLINNDVEFTENFHLKMFQVFEFDSVLEIGIVGGWRHTAHGLVSNGVQDNYFCEMDNVPAVCWLLPKKAMEKVGMLTENGVCLTKGGNGEDTSYVNRMKGAGFLVGVTKEDCVHHIDGY